MNVNNRKRPIPATLPPNPPLPTHSQQLGDWSEPRWWSRKFGRRDRSLGPNRLVPLSLMVI